MPNNYLPEQLQIELNRPFAESVQIQKPVYERGRKTGVVTAVPWHEYARRLNELVPGGWGAEVAHMAVVGEKLLMVVDVEINNQTRSGTGSANADKENWGGAHAEAFSQAFRRGCALHGLGLSMYRKDDDTATPTVPPARPPNRDNGEELRGDKPTALQHTRLRQLAESEVFGDVEIENYKSRLRKSFTKTTAGAIIREMKEVYGERTGRDFEPPSEN